MQTTRLPLFPTLSESEVAHVVKSTLETLVHVKAVG